MQVYRITQTKYAGDLSGEGAFRAGGRWNSKGVRMLYTSTSRALAVLEVLVHLSATGIRPAMTLMTFEIPDDSVASVDELPPDWNSKPFGKETAAIGDLFVSESESLALAVPSVVIPEEYNILISSTHPDLRLVTESHRRDYFFDSRL